MRRAGRELVEVSRESVEFSSKSVEISKESVEFIMKSVNVGRESVESEESQYTTKNELWQLLETYGYFWLLLTFLRNYDSFS